MSKQRTNRDRNRAMERLPVVKPILWGMSASVAGWLAGGLLLASSVVVYITYDALFGGREIANTLLRFAVIMGMLFAGLAVFVSAYIFCVLAWHWNEQFEQHRATRVFDTVFLKSIPPQPGDSIKVRCTNCRASNDVVVAAKEQRLRCGECRTIMIVEPGETAPLWGKEIEFDCENCDETLICTASAIDKNVRCDSCGHVFRTPRSYIDFTRGSGDQEDDAPTSNKPAMPDYFTVIVSLCTGAGFCLIFAPFVYGLAPIVSMAGFSLSLYLLKKYRCPVAISIDLVLCVLFFLAGAANVIITVNKVNEAIQQEERRQRDFGRQWGE